jgi:hypothetical protein
LKKRITQRRKGRRDAQRRKRNMATLKGASI